MLFGSTDDFGIETMLEPNLELGSLAWGRARLWIQGVEFGDYSREHCTLGMVSDRMKKLEADLEVLWSEEFASLTDLERMNKVDGVLYGYHGDVPLPDNGEYVDGRPYKKYDLLTNWGEMFDGIGKAFIFSPPGEEVFVLHRGRGSGASVRRLVTTRTAVRAATRPFVAWFQLENHKLNGAPLPK